MTPFAGNLRFCRFLAAVILSLLWAALPATAVAQTDPCPQSPPDYKYLRYDEDYQYLRNPACKTDALDALKYVPLNADGSVYVSFGGEVREDIEHFNDPAWGQDPQGTAIFPGALHGSCGFPFRAAGSLFCAVQERTGIRTGRRTAGAH